MGLPAETEFRLKLALISFKPHYFDIFNNFKATVERLIKILKNIKETSCRKVPNLTVFCTPYWDEKSLSLKQILESLL